MHKIKGNPVNNAEEYELLYFQGYGLDYLYNHAAFLNEDIVIDANNNLVVGTQEGFAWSNFELTANDFHVPYAYKVVVFYNDAEGASHVVWSQDLNADNGYMVNLPTGLYADYPQYELAIAVCWKYADLFDVYEAQIEFGDWTEWNRSDVIDFEISDEGFYTVRAHGTGFSSSDLSNCIEYRIG